MKAQLFEQPCALTLLLILPLYHSDNLKMMLLAYYLGASLGSGARRQISPDGGLHYRRFSDGIHFRKD